jgi:SNF2 family DNA or RNA helicase
MATCREFRRVFGADLVVLPALVRWANEEVKREQALEEARSGKAADLTRLREVAPQLYMAMDARPYQLSGTTFQTTGGQVLLGDQPGLGKTLITLASLIEHGAQRILVMCPRTATRTVWERETARWTPTIATFVAQGDRKHREAEMAEFDKAWFRTSKHTANMLVCNTEMMRIVRKWRCPDGTELQKHPGMKGGCQMGHDHKVVTYPEYPFLFKGKWDAIVLDESHNALATTKNVQSKTISQVRFGAVRLRRQLADNGLALALSGTPARSKLPRFWGTLNWLRPDAFSSYWNFAKRHFKVDDDGYGLVVGTDVLDQEAFDQELRPYYLARTKADVAADLPPITYAGTPPDDNPDGLNGVWLDMGEDQAQAYDKMVEMAQATIEGGTLTANGMLAEITRRRQFACSYGRMTADRKFAPTAKSNKLEWILEFLEEREGHEGKVVIASSFTQIVDLFAAELRKAGHEVLTLTGATSDKARADLVRRFANPDDSARVAIINTFAGGEAITLDQADDMIFTDLPWTSDQAEQVEARIHRVSRIHNVTVWRLLSKGTIDEWMAGTNDEQRQRMLTAKPQAIKEMP